MRITHHSGIYLKKVDRRGDIAIWLVDGSRVRSELDNEFTNYGQHFRFPFIPENEFWLDREAVANERKFFVDHLLVEWERMRLGDPYEKAIAIADRKELAERHRAMNYRSYAKKNPHPLVEKVHSRLLKNIHEELDLWIVFGDMVRNFLRVEFTEGGHDLVYAFVPSKEIWIDNDVLAYERPLIILHELHERSLMAEGKTYAVAHKSASKLEWNMRHAPKRLDFELQKLGWES